MESPSNGVFPHLFFRSNVQTNWMQEEDIIIALKKKSHAPYLKSIYINSQNLNKSN